MQPWNGRATRARDGLRRQAGRAGPWFALLCCTLTLACQALPASAPTPAPPAALRNLKVGIAGAGKTYLPLYVAAE